VVAQREDKYFLIREPSVMRDRLEWEAISHRTLGSGTSPFLDRQFRLMIIRTNAVRLLPISMN
jgi:hypothetical protein